jgi:hypothetical protein
MASETFSPQGYLRPDWSAPGNWSGGAVPGAGTEALVNGIDVWIDPQTKISANIVLEGGAALIGNGGGFSLTAESSVQADDQDALYANGAIINSGAINVEGPGAALNIVVQAGQEIAGLYGLAVPSFENTGSVAVAGGATINISGTELSNTGTMFVNDGALIVNGGWVDGGQGALIPGGEIEISAGGYAAFSDGVIDQNFVFNGPGTLAFGDPGDVSADAIAGFGYRDDIITGSVEQAESLLADGLTITTALPDFYTLAVQPIAGGAEIYLREANTPPCFARGTRILTPGGYAPVEQLEPGALVVTASGGVRAVQWVGWRTVDLATHRRPEAVRPICVLRDAVADGFPSRDVRLSPDHGLYLDGQLVPAKLLTNAATIIRDLNCQAVTYYHIELDRHDILLADNLPVESYIDTGNRQAFENSDGTPWASPVFGRGRQWDSGAYADLCISGPRLRGIRQNLLRRVEARGYLHKTMPDIYLMVDGVRIERDFGPASLPCFRLNTAHSGIISIRSASFIPAELSPGSETGDDDWRELGVAIRRIKLDLHSVAAPEIAESGFYPRASKDIADWTNGNGVVRVPRQTALLGLNISALPKGWQAPLGALNPV